jgi:hypothetical protein
VLASGLLGEIAQRLKKEDIFDQVEKFRRILPHPRMLPLSLAQIHVGPRYYSGILARSFSEPASTKTQSAARQLEVSQEDQTVESGTY